MPFLKYVLATWLLVGGGGGGGGASCFKLEVRQLYKCTRASSVYHLMTIRFTAARFEMLLNTRSK